MYKYSVRLVAILIGILKHIQKNWHMKTEWCHSTYFMTSFMNLKNIYRFPLFSFGKEMGFKTKLSLTNIVLNYLCPMFDTNYLTNYLIWFKINQQLNS